MSVGELTIQSGWCNQSPLE